MDSSVIASHTILVTGNHVTYGICQIYELCFIFIFILFYSFFKFFNLLFVLFQPTLVRCIGSKFDNQQLIKLFSVLDGILEKQSYLVKVCMVVVFIYKYMIY